MNGRTWTDKDIDYLINKYKAGMPVDEIAKTLGFSKSGVYSKLAKLRKYQKNSIPRRSNAKPKAKGAQRKRQWGGQQERILLALLTETSLSFERIAVVMNYSSSTIKKYARELQKLDKWSPEERPQELDKRTNSHVESVIKHTQLVEKERKRLERDYWLERAQLYDMGLL